MSTESHRHSEESEEHPIQKLAALAQTLFNFVACAGATILMWQETQSWRPFALAILIIPIHLLSKIAWNIGDAFRGFVAPNTYFTRGAKDAFKKKVFWLIGPQSTASFWTIMVAWSIGYIALAPKEPPVSSIDSTPTTEVRSMPAEVAVSKESNNTNVVSLPSVTISANLPGAPLPQDVGETTSITSKSESALIQEIAATQQPESWTSTRQVAAPSFDCQKATTEQEHLICGSEELSDLDIRLTNAYQNQMSQATNKSELKKNQIQWLTRVRAACRDAECLTMTYRDRLEQLEAMSR